MEYPSAESAGTANLERRLAQIEQLLGTDPASAESRADELLQSVPGQPMALLFQGIARRLKGDPASAIPTLERLAKSFSEAPLPRLQLGLALRETGKHQAAAAAMRRAVALKPDFSDAWLALADLLVATGDAEGADRAFAMYTKHCTGDPRLLEPAAALRENRLERAEVLLRKNLETYPNDVAALCMLADVAARQAQLSRARRLLERCLELAPGYQAARHNLAVVLLRLDRPAHALEQVERLVHQNATAALLALKASILVRLARHDEAIEVYDALLAAAPEARTWASLGHTLRTVGQLDRSVNAYREAIALEPQFGEAWWNLANLKTFRFDDADLAEMQRQLANPRLGLEDRIHFHFAAGKAHEDRTAFEEAFAHYAEGNRLRRESAGYNEDAMAAHVRRSKALLSTAFFAKRSAYGTASAEPIFIVGLPRAGSTLVEQILASHSLVEGTMELPHITGIVKSLAEKKRTNGEAAFVDVLESLGESESRELGEAYLEVTGPQRSRQAEFFIDKMPNNFAHVGLIQLILPKAKIIDVRRHPIACGMSLFRHLFASGQTFSYRLEDIGRYYGQYLELMAHFDAVLPGRVHRILYESLVNDTEREVRRLLDYCALPFEDSCLRFYENRRAVSTPSSEQVRSPIFREGLEHWRHFEPWLEPLKTALGAHLHDWRGAAG